MNGKLIKASMAGTAAVALLVGGSTFAAWSDFDVVEDNVTSAGHLVLDLDGSGPIANSVAIAPGEERTIDFFVASANLDGVPQADLSFSVNDIADQENDCSSGSEAAVDDCETVNDGEFSEQSYVRVRYSEPVTDPQFANNQCPGVTLSNGDTGSNDPSLWESLREISATPYELGQLTGGQGVCVRLDIGLPPTADNATQGDSSEFDLRFDLEQAF